jgi:hypothetical protein
METAGSSETPVYQVAWFHTLKASLFNFSKVKAIQRNTNEMCINFVRAMEIFDSSTYGNNTERRILRTERRHCLDVPKDSNKLCKPYNENILSNECYGDDKNHRE